MSSILSLFMLISVVAGDTVFTPTAPGPGDVFKAGKDCTIAWKPGNWTNVTITLMSGSNTDMNLVAPVAHDIDGSDPSLSPFTWTCPEVDPYSAIYFYQFKNGNDTTWTTRFTITSPSGSSNTPEHSSQPNGDAIPWGIGSLRNSSTTTNAQSNPPRPNGETDQSSPASSSLAQRTAATMNQRQATPTIVFPNISSMTQPTSTTSTTSSLTGHKAENGVGFLGPRLTVPLAVFVLPGLYIYGVL
ncbi:hypothetical protein D9758_008898 [Tetrapyrgos nigripes]|uniref:Yeast cell wall synthesis Kre9/Knh1-like N-terminal domain-containing protein n=1 Tax=Tetrapyrgos nigripes TaxID=182062 RepID=A0A8H5FNU9_9AGAR|nr:hypothetical protein D9758_008898 [Tetrapyrgos nigripes]